MKHLDRVAVAVLLAGGVLYASSTSALERAAAPTAEGIQQFRAGGQVVGFGPGAFYLSDATYVLRVEFAGARPVAPQSDAPAATAAKGAPPLRRVTYTNLWDGITLTYEAVDGGLARSTYRLEPGTDPGAIRLRYNVPVTLAPDGTLTLSYPTGRLTESAPLAWQEMNGRRVPVSVSFAVHKNAGSESGELVGFSVGAHDPACPLIIDPTLTWNAFLGGSGDEYLGAIAVDGVAVYAAGTADTSWGTPVQTFGGDHDAFVAKLNASSGALIWHTFLGSGGHDDAIGIAYGGLGVYLTGISFGTWGIPVRAFSGTYDAFVARLDSTSGALTWNTFLGSGDGDEGVAVAYCCGGAYVTGKSWAAWGAPVRPFGAADDAFVAKLDATSGALTWHTFLGGSQVDMGHAVRVDAGGNIYVAGSSGGAWGMPVRPYSGGLGDAFVAKLNDWGVLLWHTFLGGSGWDRLGAVAVNDGSAVYVAGQSNATWGTPVRGHSGNDDVFAARLDASGGLTWVTFLGGIYTDLVGNIALDSASADVYVTGASSQAWGTPLQPHSGGISDAFVAVLDSASGGIERSVFLGGLGEDGGGGIALDSNGRAYVTGYSDTAWGTPVRGHSGGFDAFVAKIDLRDTDNDGLMDVADNCPAVYNPDQRNSDGLADGGDLCDPCPSSLNNGAGACNVAKSGAASIGSSGGTLAIPGVVTIDVPAGAVGTPTSFSVTAVPRSSYGLGTSASGSGLVNALEIQPEGVTFATPVTMTFRWPDDPPPGDSVVDNSGGIPENFLRIWRNGVATTNVCSLQTCGAIPCCNPWVNYWVVEVNQFSEWAIAADPCDVGQILTPKLVLSRLLVTGDNVLRFLGTVTLPAGKRLAHVDPSTHGLSFVLGDTSDVVVGTTLPGGLYNGTSGWKLSADGSKRIYLNRSPTPPGGVTKAVVKELAPGELKLTVTGKRNSFFASPAVQVSVVFTDALGTRYCYDTDFPGPAPLPVCGYNPSGTKLTCKGPAPLPTRTPTLTRTPTQTATPTVTPTPGWQWIWVLGTGLPANFGGLSAADALCQAEGTATFGAATYKAWLSDGTQNAEGRLTHSTQAYKLPDGTKVADDWADLTDGTLDAPINENAAGSSVASQVWTASASSGNGSSGHCLNWTSTASGEYGLIGSTTATDSTWSYLAAAQCTSEQRFVYCIEQ